ncbi:unnamed protein product [Cuscuta campestris]|uniref:DUF4219 domain-containing protein n=1 Tax=Cuscuta campestris TaxID=132261 RepID=A0A484LI71_9ASTE|nr:unnamed protein product [Cuscuta campestris]
MDSMNSQSITKPPFFNGDNYGYWKMRMENFIQSIDYDLWIVTTHGPFVPMTTVGEHQVPTPMDKLTTEDKKKLSLNAKALNVLFCALGQDEFARVSSCKSAKEAWKLLEATHEGDKDTKATKIALGTSEYDNFKMKAGESVQDMNKRFNLIVNNLSHIKPECPKLKKKEELKKGKKKALKVTWDDLNFDKSDSNQSQEENANACFMVSNDEEENHPRDTIIGDIEKGVRTRNNYNLCAHYAFVSQFEPKNVEDALKDSDWIISMQLELEQFERNKGWISDSQDFNADFCLRVLNNIALDHVFEDPDYFLRWPNVQDLTANRFILLKILKENVIPILNKDKQVGIYECTLLYLLLTHKKINLPSIIIQHMYESSGRQNKPYGMLLTHIFAKREILEVRPSRVRFLDAECLGYCGLVKIGEEYYMKKEFQKLDAVTRAEYGPRRSMSSLPSTSRAPQDEAEENANTEVPVRAPRVKRSKSSSHASSASLMHRHSHMASTSKNPFKKFKKFILKTVVALMKKFQESLDDLSDRIKKMEDRENRQKQNEDRASRRRR